LEEGVDAEVNYCNGEAVTLRTPLEEVIGAEEEGGMGVSLIKGREGAIVRTMYKTIARAIDL